MLKRMRDLPAAPRTRRMLRTRGATTAVRARAASVVADDLLRAAFVARRQHLDLPRGVAADDVKRLLVGPRESEVLRRTRQRDGAQVLPLPAEHLHADGGCRINAPLSIDGETVGAAGDALRVSLDTFVFRKVPLGPKGAVRLDLHRDQILAARVVDVKRLLVGTQLNAVWCGGAVGDLHGPAAVRRDVVHGRRER